jgi:putative aldouronate transport system substrate-binding protein
MLLVSVAAMGCSSGKEAASENKGKAEQPQAGSDAKKDSEKKPVSGKLIAEPREFKWMLGENPVQQVKNDTPAIDEIFKRTNVKLKLEPVPSSNYDDKKNALIASNNIPDIIKVEGRDIQDFARTGIFLPISDYLDHAPNFKKAIETRPEINKLKVEGKLYGFPTLEKFRVAVAPSPLIRADLLKKLNLQPPKSFDELYQVLKKLKEAYPASIPMTNRNGTRYLVGQLAYPLGYGGFPNASTSGMYFEPASNKYIYGPTSAGFKEVVSFLNKLYKEKLLDPDYAVNTKNMMFEKLSSGKSFFYYDNNTFAARVFNPALKQIDPNAMLDILPPLQNDKGTTRGYRLEQDWLDKNYAISSKVKNPIDYIKFFDWLYSDEGMLITNFGLEGQTYDMKNGKPWIKEEIVQQHKNHEDVFSAIQSTLGVGLLAFAPLVDETTYLQVTDPFMLTMGEHIEKYTKSGQLKYIPRNPTFTKEETQKLKRLETQVNTKFEQEIDKFIMGTRPIADYDAFAKQLMEKDVPEIEKIYNDALQRLGK